MGSKEIKKQKEKDADYANYLALQRASGQRVEELDNGLILIKNPAKSTYDESGPYL